MEIPGTGSGDEIKAADAHDPEVTWLLREIKRSGWLTGVSLAGCAVLACAIMLGALSVCIYQGPADWRFTALVWGAIAGAGIIMWNVLARRRRADHIRLLARYQDKRIVPVLLQEIQSPDYGDDYASFRAALIATLPAFEEGDKHLLPPKPAPWLRYRLQTMEPALACGLLEAIARSGCTWALPDVEWFLKREHSSARIQVVHDAAARCAQALKQHIEAARSPKRLLRPAKEIPPEELLRAASSSQESQDLLRPIDEDEQPRA